MRWRMRGVRRRAGGLAVLALAVCLAACIPGPNGGGWGVGSHEGNASTHELHAAGGLVVAIVPELQPVMEALVPVWAAAHPDIPLAFTVGTALTNAENTNTNIQTDVLITDLDQGQFGVASQGAIPGPGIVFGGATLVFAMPAANPAGIATLQQVATSNLRLINTGWDSGISWYTIRALQKMMRDPAFAPVRLPCRSTYSTCVYANIVTTAPDGLTAARLLAGQTSYDGAFVYQSDVDQVNRERGAGTLIAIPVPVSLAPPNPLWCAVGGLAAPNPAQARQFQQFLLGPQAQVVLAAYGFVPPSQVSSTPGVTP